MYSVDFQIAKSDRNWGTAVVLRTQIYPAESENCCTCSPFTPGRCSTRCTPDALEQVGVKDLAQGHLISSWGQEIICSFPGPREAQSGDLLLTILLQEPWGCSHPPFYKEQNSLQYSTCRINTFKCFPWFCLPLNKEKEKDRASLFPHPNNLYNLPSCCSFFILYWFSSSVLYHPWPSSNELFSSLSLTHLHTLSPAYVATLNRFSAPSIWSTTLFCFQYNTSQSCMLMVYCFADWMHCVTQLLSKVFIAVCHAEITYYVSPLR